MNAVRRLCLVSLSITVLSLLISPGCKQGTSVPEATAAPPIEPPAELPPATPAVPPAAPPPAARTSGSLGDLPDSFEVYERPVVVDSQRTVCVVHKKWDSPNEDDDHRWYPKRGEPFPYLLDVEAGTWTQMHRLLGLRYGISAPPDALPPYSLLDIIVADDGFLVTAKQNDGTLLLFPANSEKAVYLYEPYFSAQVQATAYARDAYLAVTISKAKWNWHVDPTVEWSYPDGVKTFIWKGPIEIAWPAPKDWDSCAATGCAPVEWWHYLGQCAVSTAAWHGTGFLVTSGGFDDNNKVFLIQKDKTILSQVDKEGIPVHNMGVDAKPADILGVSVDMKWLATRQGPDVKVTDSKETSYLASRIHRVLGVSLDGDLVGVAKNAKTGVYEIVVISAGGKHRKVLDSVKLDTMAACSDGKIVYVKGRKVVWRDSGVRFRQPDPETQPAVTGGG